MSSTSAKEKLTIMVSATALKSSGCMLRTYYQVFKGYRHGINANDIEFGSAFHIFREHFRAGEGDSNFAQAYHKAVEYYINTPMYIKSKKQYLTAAYLQQACLDYMTTYAKDDVKPVKVETSKLGGAIKAVEEGQNVVPLLECKFAIPYYVDDDMEVIIAGTLDELAKIQSGIYVIEDCKTSAVWNVDEYFFMYQLNPQMYLYRWAIKELANLYPDSIWAEINNSEVGIQIDGVFHNGANKITFQRSPVEIFKPEKLVEFECLLERKMHDIIEMARGMIFGAKPLREGIINGACQTVYGPCTYAKVCAAPDDFAREVLLERDFITKFFNPLSYNE